MLTFPTLIPTPPIEEEEEEETHGHEDYSYVHDYESSGDFAIDDDTEPEDVNENPTEVDPQVIKLKNDYQERLNKDEKLKVEKVNSHDSTIRGKIEDLENRLDEVVDDGIEFLEDEFSSSSPPSPFQNFSALMITITLFILLKY